ncbi:TolC family outer membrane protein [Pseudophaeobacter arcticus]|jgi:outer membrane protein|uniref:TolC family outer membrane protein n=1 Tax=Pseudophaeobacter arcticus TaxID=385492 RepID=UPI0004247773|nr:TolC family outer membrane protein [Pseudophaeobacter arcticus]
MLKKNSASLLKTFVFVGSVALAFTLPKPASADNLSDALIGAYKSSGLLEQNRALLRVQDENVAAAVAGLRPIINWTITAATQNTHNVNGPTASSSADRLSTGLALELLLYDGGATRLKQLAAQQTVLATRQSLLNVEQQVLFGAVQAYVNVLSQQETVRLQGNNLRLLQEELKASQDRFEVGEVTRTDVALAQSRLASARATLIQSRGDLLTAQASYVEAVGHPIGTTAGQPPLPKRVASLQAAESIAVRNHPILLGQQHTVKAADFATDAARKGLGPNVKFGAEISATTSLSNNFESDSTGASITYTQPIYAGGRLASSVRSAIASADAARGQLLSTQRAVAQDVSEAYVTLEAASASLVSSSESVRAAQVAFDGIREEATLGARTTLDVLQAEQDLLNALTARVRARASQATAAYALLQAQGLLTAEHLGLAVEIYDPTLYYNLVKGAPAQVSRQSRDLDRVLRALGRN